MLSRKLYLAIPTLLLVPILALMPVLTAANPPSSRALALAKADATKSEALARLNNEATYISQADQARLTDKITRAIDTEMNTLRASYDRASADLESQIGYLTPWWSVFRRLWNGPEEAQRVFQEKIDAAIAHAGLPAQRDKAAGVIDAALLDAATAEYQAYRARFNKILYDTINESGGLGILTKDLVKELIARIDQTSHQFAAKEGLVDAQVAMPTPTASLTALSGIVMARIARSVMLTAGQRYAARTVGQYLLSILTGPIGWGILALSTAYDIWNARANALEECNKVLWQSYDAFAKAYRDSIPTATKAVVAGLEQQLEADRRAAQIQMDRFFRGILVQAGSPGYDEFARTHGEQVASKGLERIAAAFGDDFVNIPIDVKYELVSDIGAQKAGDMLQAHGQAFVDLYTRERRALTDVMRNPQYAKIILDVFGNERPTVAFYKQSLDRFGSLDAQQTDALILAHQLHPTKKAEEINKDALTIIGASASRLAAIKTQNPQAAAITVDWVLNGQMSGTLLNRLAAHGHAATLLSLPLYLGPDSVTKMLSVADETTILKFLADFTAPGESQARAMAYLREDAAGHLKSYSAPTGGGPKTVLARHTLLQEYGGTLPAEADRTLHWLLAHTSVAHDQIHKTTIENLHAMGIPGGVIPIFVAIPTARMVAATGLLGPVAIVLALLSAAGLAIARVAFRVALPFPLRRRRIAERPMLNVTQLSRRNRD
jgi:hypothetical protein